mgnify:CR=1 FL=1
MSHKLKAIKDDTLRELLVKGIDEYQIMEGLEQMTGEELREIHEIMLGCHGVFPPNGVVPERPDLMISLLGIDMDANGIDSFHPNAEEVFTTAAGRSVGQLPDPE